ncbi:MAG: hypothetical protein H6815_06790 [Phycisphaeraceae bacterium]|nr:hypothetical protein [Phycisphaerales bacterium]MCB9860145.1 hypothetical protein [Phycisphaeraceae bacterium]
MTEQRLFQNLPQPSPSVDGLAFAVRVTPDGCEDLHWDDLDRLDGSLAERSFDTNLPVKSVVWVHLDLHHDRARSWVRTHIGLTSDESDAMLGDFTQPHSVVSRDSLLLFLRGVNCNPNADLEDLISIRAFLTPSLIVTMRSAPIRSSREVLATLRKGMQIAHSIDIFIPFLRQLLAKVEAVSDQLGDSLGELEEEMIDKVDQSHMSKLTTLRQQIIQLRRYIRPQREMLESCPIEELTWSREIDTDRLAHCAHTNARVVEELMMFSERSHVLQDDAANAQVFQLTRSTYLLTKIASIFLPLGLLTGLLGVNVDGIPLKNSPWGFAIVCAALLALGIVMGVVIRRVDRD